MCVAFRGDAAELAAFRPLLARLPHAEFAPVAAEVGRALKLSAAAKMPSFEGKISDQEFNDLVAYLSTL